MNYFTLFLLTPSLQNGVCILHMLSSHVWTVTWVLTRQGSSITFYQEHVVVPEGTKVMMCLQTMSSSCFHQIESKLKQEENQDPGIWTHQGPEEAEGGWCGWIILCCLGHFCLWDEWRQWCPFLLLSSWSKTASGYLRNCSNSEPNELKKNTARVWKRVPDEDLRRFPNLPSKHHFGSSA